MNNIPNIKIAGCIYFFILMSFSGCNQTENKPKGKELANGSEETFKSVEEDNPYTSTASQWGNKTPETFIFLHSPAGLRIEYNLDRQLLQLWINPQAGKSISYKDRNLSNRDDHTDIFHKITFPNLNLADFDHCDYDAFHSKVHFKNGQVLHLVSHYESPAVVVWFEKDGIVDFKTESSGKVLTADKSTFAVVQANRGRDFTFVAAIGEGSGQFQHQLEVDGCRSIYARANLKPNQTLVIGGELSKEDVLGWTKKIASKPVKELVTENESKIAADLQTGKIFVRNNPDIQALVDVNIIGNLAVKSDAYIIIPR